MAAVSVQLAERSEQYKTSGLRLDIQGLRMVAVVLVLLDHIFGWPRGGFIGVDVFFVISGFLITGILLRDAEKYGRVSFAEFYRRRVRRIVPAATLTLATIAGVAWLMFTPGRALTVWWDSFWAFAFLSNWRFALTGTDYFTADGAVSPVRHFWSLSVEEQFYFVWPAVMAIVVLLTARKASVSTRHRIAGGIMLALVAASFTWAVIDSASNPTWSYFSTFTRVWELGFGALIAIFASRMTLLPNSIRPYMAWAGLGLIAFGAFWITERMSFPGPWAILPVAGTSLVIAAGTGGPVRYLLPITNRFSVAIGDLSYSLYLWHWPVLVFLGTFVDVGWRYYVCVIGLTCALAVLAYHFVEQPILASSWLKPRGEQEWRHQHRHRDWRQRVRRNIASRLTFTMTRERQIAGLAGVALLCLGLLPLTSAPREAPTYISNASVDTPSVPDAQDLPPAMSRLRAEITAAVKTSSWPALSPSMEQVIDGPAAPPSIEHCGDGVTTDCWFGSESAPRTLILAGDSIALSYLAPLTAFIDASAGQWRMLAQVSISCPFIDAEVQSADSAVAEACPSRKNHIVDNINRIRPQAVLIANTYGERTIKGTNQALSPAEWKSYTQQMIERFSESVGSVALLTPPPADKTPADCYRPDTSPAECVGTLPPSHLERRDADLSLVQSIGGELIDTWPLFCTPSHYCPMFVGTTPVKRDRAHISPEYGALLSPAFIELLRGKDTFA
ncbi:acyltransferase family protein [Mycobacterium sp. AMU20-3851]|uniref:acyltransferase family protein n=1 Tax=Mycobacterium sp. AMU20-3851 TaxID=3122055 RepID=UPI0037540DDF